MSRSVLAISAILVVPYATAQNHSGFPPALSQYAPLSVSSLPSFGENEIESAVRRQLLALPLFGVFDHLAFTVNGGTVVLRGQVLHPILKEDAATVVAALPGVWQVVNMVTLLQDSPADNAVRLAVFSAIYSHPSMSIYATVGGGGAIHVVVQGGRVSLEGQVGSKMDARRAVELASAQPGVVAITSHLTIGH